MDSVGKLAARTDFAADTLYPAGGGSLLLGETAAVVMDLATGD